MNDNVTIYGNNTSEYLSTDEPSYRNDCIKVVFSEMEYLPWDNPDNIVSEETENIVRRIQNNLLVLLYLIGGPANVINMAVFYKQGLKDRVNLCLFALSFTDEFFLTMFVFSYAEQLHLQFTTKERFGPVFIFVTNNNLIALLGISFVSPVLSAIIATERCLCVLNPLKFQFLLQTRTMAVVIAIAFVSVFSVAFVVVYRFRIACIYDPISRVVEMTYIEGEFYRNNRQLIDHLNTFFAGVGLIGITQLVVITTTIITIVKLRQIVTWRNKSTSTLSLQEVALTKMLVANSILFSVCMFPDAVNRFSMLFLPELNAGRRYHNFYLTSMWITDILATVNASFNIVLYYLMGSRYRETFWTLFGRKSRHEQHSN